MTSYLGGEHERIVEKQEAFECDVAHVAFDFLSTNNVRMSFESFENEGNRNLNKLDSVATTIA